MRHFKKITFSFLHFSLAFAVFLNVSVFTLQAFLIARYSFNLPYWDEWESLGKDGITLSFPIEWIFRRHNEHRIVFTKLLQWIYLLVNQWNIHTSILINWAIFGWLLASLYTLLSKALSYKNRTLILLFFPFLMTPLNYENMLSSFQSQFHFFILFFFIAISVIPSTKNWLAQTAAMIFLVCSEYSFASGFICAIVGFAWFVFGWAKDLNKPTAPDLLKVFCVSLTFLVPTYFWFSAARTPGDANQYAFPWTGEFFNYFFNIFSLGFGIVTQSFIYGFVCFLFVLFPFISCLINPELRKRKEILAIAVAITGLIGCLAVIAMGRAKLGVMQSKSSRYSEIGSMLIPLSITLWLILLEKKTRLASYGACITWLLLITSFIPVINRREYVRWLGYRHTEYNAIRNFLQKGSDPNLQSVYDVDVPYRINRAIELNLSFMKPITQ